MGFMSAWESFSKRFFNKFGSKFQSQAEEIKSWKIPDWAKEIVHKVDAIVMSAASLAFLKKFALEACKKFDDDYAKKLIESIVGVIDSEVE